MKDLNTLQRTFKFKIQILLAVCFLVEGLLLETTLWLSICIFSGWDAQEHFGRAEGFFLLSPHIAYKLERSGMIPY